MSDIGGGEQPANGMPSMGMGVNLNLPGLTTAAQQIGAVTEALGSLKTALRDLGSNSYMLTQGINSMFQSIAKNATAASTAITSVSNAVSGVSGANLGTSGGQAPQSSGAPAASTAANGTASWFSRAVSTISNVGSGQATLGTTTAANFFGPQGGVSGSGSGGAGILGSIPFVGGLLDQAADIANSVALFPYRFLRDQLGANRQTVLSTNAALGRTSFASGATSTQVLGNLARMPGGVQGPVTDLLDLFNSASSYGGFYNFAGGPNAPRAGGFLAGVREAQIINPGASLGSIAATIGGQSSNTAAQQQAQMMTGGAMGMIKMGGGQKSLSEWANDVLKWLEGLRSGSSRGKPFSYGELVAQYYPGSNIDAWFTATGVSQEMREYWWSYALAKAKGGNKEDFKITPQADSPLWNRLQATTAAAGTQFGLGGVMSGAYANKEQSNRFFNDIYGRFLQTTIPSMVSNNFAYGQFIPDTMEQIFMTMLENSGLFGTIVAGGASGLLGNIGSGILDFAEGLPGVGGAIGVGRDAGNWLTDKLTPGHGGVGGMIDWLTGDVGDIGAYTTTGGTSTAGLHPDMRRKVNAMMRANPRLKVNSGLRDHRMQKTLAARGVGKVSGKPSAHTRGMAADLGPASEYGWISANAHKFGLSSGRSKGEPWHVGMGDVGDIWDAWDLISDFKNMISSSGSEAIEGTAGVTGSMLGFLASLLGGKDINYDNLAFIPDVYSQMMDAAGGRFSNKGITSGSGALGVGTGGGGGASGWQGGFSGDEAQRAAATYGAAYAAGFRGDALDKIVSIAYRESRWTPSAHRTDRPPKYPDPNSPMSGDRGLFQLNYIWDPQFTAAGIIPSNTPEGKRSLMDPLVNAKGAYYVSKGGTDWAPWSAIAGVGWAAGGDPFAGTGAGATSAAAGKAAAQQAGWIGDLGLGEATYDYMAQRAPAQNSTGITFTNTFVIGGGGANVNGGGIDARRTATLIADHLEDEMDRRMARRN